jgi:predicted nucleic acid-binding protein
LREDEAIAVWWATQIECAAALARRERDGELDVELMSQALGRLDGLAANWHEIEPSAEVRRIARRLVRVHPLRAADALQLAAAVVASYEHPSSLPFVTLDRKLADAARREGFPVLEPTP